MLKNWPQAAAQFDLKSSVIEVSAIGASPGVNLLILFGRVY
jgi:hypothetical protein